MAETYIEMRQRQQKEVNDFPCFFAFSDEQFNKGMENLGLKPNDTAAICRGPIPAMFLKKDDAKSYIEMMKRLDKELREAIAADDGAPGGFICEIFRYELDNHEFAYTGEIEETIDSLGLSIEEIDASESLKAGLRNAVAIIRDREESA